MFINPVTLIDQTVENLELLSEFFADELDERTHHPTLLTPEARTCKEALAAIRTLTPHLKSAMDKLRSARVTQEPQGLPPHRVCANCDE